MNKINMEYSKIIAVTGLPGLYELLNSKSDGAIVRSLEDKSSKFVSNRIHNFSHLESIEVFTTRENTNLVDVLKAMDSSKEKLPDEKDNAALKNYFKKVYPELDFDRVYSSDLKKMVKWFSVLKANNVEIKLTEETVEEPAPVVKEKVKKETPAAEAEKPAAKPKKAAAKKTESQKETKKEKETIEEVKPKKAPAKKKTKE
jgi:hypothetical protein